MLSAGSSPRANMCESCSEFMHADTWKRQHTGGSSDMEVREVGSRLESYTESGSGKIQTEIYRIT